MPLKREPSRLFVGTRDGSNHRRTGVSTMADVGISTDVVDSNTLWRRFFTAIELLLLACDEMDGDPDLEDEGETGDALDEAPSLTNAVA